MVLSDVERSITKTVVHRFLDLKEPSPRPLLARRHRFSQFHRLRDSGILRNIAETAPTGEEVYLPRALAFHYCGDTDALRIARESVTTVIRALQNLFDVELDKKQFTPRDLEAQASKIFEHRPEPETLKLGLYLANDIGVVTLWGPATALMEPEIFQIAEHIVEIRDFDKVWDEFIARSTLTWEDSPHKVILEAAPSACEYAKPIDLGWPLIHPEIVKVAKTRFDTEHFADAAEAAFKVINERMKEIVKVRTGSEYDGVALMQRAFSRDKPVLVLGDLSTMIGEDMQVGYQQIFSGAMRGIRNPKAHANVQIDAVRSMHFIFLASLLMCKVDEALDTEAPSTVGIAGSTNRAETTKEG
jgi:uncharacterized protein (TIGR02391 family)